MVIRVSKKPLSAREAHAATPFVKFAQFAVLKKLLVGKLSE